jgi:alpha-amylase
MGRPAPSCPFNACEVRVKLPVRIVPAKLFVAASLSLILTACGGSDANDTQVDNTRPTVEGVAIQGEDSIDMLVGDSMTLSAKVSYSDSTEVVEAVTWESSDATVLSIDAVSGVARAHKKGIVFVTATEGGKQSPSIIVTVSEKPVVEEPPKPCALATVEIVATPAKNTLNVGESFDYDVKGKCANGEDKALSVIAWSTNSTAVELNKTTGVVKALVKGNATINVSADGKTAFTQLTIAQEDEPEEPKKVETFKITVGDVTYPYTYDFCPRKASEAAKTRNQLPLVAWLAEQGKLAVDATSAVTWSSSDAAKATVKAGVVEALGTGKVTVKAKSAAGTEASYELDIPACSITLFAKKPAEWAALKAHAWVSAAAPITGAWPGMDMSGQKDGWLFKTFQQDAFNAVLNDGGKKQTVDLENITQTSWCEIQPGATAEEKAKCKWVPFEAPKSGLDITIAPGSTTFSDTLDVALNYDSAVVTLCSYSLDGTDPFALTKACPSKLTLGGTAKVGDKVTLKVCVTDSTMQKCKQETYTKVQKQTFAKAKFTWENAMVYFVLTDRFKNGDTTNDLSYGRTKDDANENIGTFHGGDLKGLMEKLDYIDSMGYNAIWISSPYEQIHGWVRGTSYAEAQSFKHYAYHGYWPLDFTVLDQNMGVIESGYGKNVKTNGARNDFRDFVDAAHARGIRVVMDVVMNHPGFETLMDMSEFGIDVVDSKWKTDPNLLNTYGNYFYKDKNKFPTKVANWANWWGPEWLRFGDANSGWGYDPSGTDSLTQGFAYLPDIKTESPAFVDIPVFYKNKQTNATKLSNHTVRKYLVKWLTDWVREYGIDGFRVDTVKHVEQESWMELKKSGVAALAEWKAKNPSKALDDLPFWMAGEVFGWWGSYGPGWAREEKVDPKCNEEPGKPPCVRVFKETVDSFARGGFDALINFQAQFVAATNPDSDPLYKGSSAPKYASAYKFDSLCAGNTGVQLMYQEFSDRARAPGMMTYLSSHDTDLFYSVVNGSDRNQMNAGTALLMMPRTVQIYYGDESGRKWGPTRVDLQQRTRSDMNWNSMNQKVLDHWQKLGQFRAGHAAVGAGAHSALDNVSSGCAFSRSYNGDHVAVVMGAQGGSTVKVPLKGLWPNGTTLRDFYTKATATVANDGSVSFKADANGVILIEKNM